MRDSIGVGDLVFGNVQLNAGGAVVRVCFVIGVCYSEACSERVPIRPSLKNASQPD
jgi:hypothetical protein